MSNIIKFLPARKGDVIAYAKQTETKATATGFVPASVGLTAGDVTKLTTVHTNADGDYTTVAAIKQSAKARTDALSAPGGSYDQLVDHLRYIGNKMRVSDASDDAIKEFGISRRDPGATPKVVPMEAPNISVDAAQPGFLRVRFSAKGSAQPRARAKNTIGVQIAVVDAGKTAMDGEADTVPYVTITRSPQNVSSTQMPAQGRLYGRWIGPRGHVSAWSASQDVTVP